MKAERVAMGMEARDAHPAVLLLSRICFTPLVHQHFLSALWQILARTRGGARTAVFACCVVLQWTSANNMSQALQVQPGSSAVLRQ